MMKRIAITGSNGFIGRKLVEKFLSNGHYVYGLDISDQHPISHINFRYIKSNLIDFGSELVDDLDIVFHLAWAGVSPEQRNDFDIQLNNLIFSKNVIEFALRKNAKKIVFLGSAMEYSDCASYISKETLPSPVNLYSSIKASSRLIFSQMCDEKGIEFVYIVISSIYSEDRKDNNVVYYTIDSLLKNERPKLTTLEQRWNFIHISDVIEAMFLVGTNYDKKRSFYTLGGLENLQLKQYIVLIRDLINPELPLGIGEIPSSKTRHQNVLISNQDLFEDYGYIPRTKFEDGIKIVIERVRNSINGKI